MAEVGRREATPDPLSLNAGQRQAQVNLPTYGVRNPGQSGGNTYSKAAVASLGLLGRVSTALANVKEAQAADWRTEGQVLRAQGVAEDEVIREGNPYKTEGYQALRVSEGTNNFYLQESEFLAGEGADMSPDEYAERLSEHKKAIIESAGDDPAVQRVALAGLEDTMPRLAAAQVKAHNERNREKTMIAGTDGLISMASAASDASRPVRGMNIRATDVPVFAPVDYNENDRDVAIRTMLGEAGGEDDLGLAAVGHVLINRSRDKRWGGSIQDVALQDKQFSTWNAGAGGNNPGRFNADSPAYQRAGQIWDLIAQGKHVDPTGGATHYYSPKGMDALVAEGSQNNTVPGWWSQETGRSKGYVKIGNHLFAGKAEGSTSTIKRSADEGYKEQQSLLDPLADVGGDVPPVQTVPTAHVPDTNMIRRYLMGLPAKDEDKGIILGAAVVRMLEQDNDTLYNDAQVRTMLNDLGAPLEVINRVDKAHERFQSRQEKSYDVDYERERAALETRAANGAFKSDDEAITATNELNAKYNKGDSEAKSIVRSVVADARAARKDGAIGPEIIPIEARSDAQAGMTRVLQGLSTPEEEAEAMQKKWGKVLKPADIDGFMATMFSKAEGRRTQTQAKIKAAMEKARVNEASRAEVTEALGRGFGLNALTGNVTDDQGVEMSKKQFGINQLRTSIYSRWEAAVKSGDVDQGVASVQMNKELYEALAKQDVPDEKFGRQMSAAVTGSIIDEKTKKVTPQALNAFDVYMQLRDNPNIGPEYVSRMLTEEADTMFTTAATLYDGQMDIGQALQKAHIILNQDLDVNRTLEKNALFNASVDTAVKSTIDGLINGGGMLNRLISGTPVRKEDIQASLSSTQNTQIASQYVEQVAKGLYFANPRIPMEALMEKAKNQLAKDSVLVGGNLIIGRSDRGERLDQVMGIDGLGKDAAYRAVDEYLMTLGPQYKEWKNLWKHGDRHDVNPAGFDPYTRHSNHYEVVFNPSMGAMQIQLYKDESRTEYKGPPIIVPAKEVGDWYSKKTATYRASVGHRIGRAVKEFLAPRRMTPEQIREAIANGDNVDDVEEMPTVDVQKGPRTVE